MLNLNNQLKESITTNTLIINITEEDYNKINKIIKELRQKYCNSLDRIKKNNDKNIESINTHSQIVKDIILDVLNYYEETKKYNVCAFLTGSFARCSNKKNSDIDFQIAYPQKYKNKLFKYEEIVFYIISNIVGINRSNVHSMLISRMDRDNINYLEEKLDSNPLIIKLHSPIGNINYSYSANTKRRIYLEYGNNNSLENVFKYLKLEIENNNKEWAHIFWVITQKEKFEEYYQELLKYEKKLLTEERITKRKSRLINKIQELETIKKEIDLSIISNFKYFYQKKQYALLNEYISYKRDVYLLTNKEWKYINYYENQKYLKEDKIFYEILEYILTLSKIVEPLGKRYSLHSDEKIIIKEYEQIERKRNYINNKIKDLIKGDNYE